MEKIVMQNGATIQPLPDRDEQVIRGFRQHGKRRITLMNSLLATGLTCEDVEALLQACEERNPFFEL